MGVVLDLGSPAISLALSHCLVGIGIRAHALRSELVDRVATVVAETSSHCSLSWRIDTTIEDDEHSPSAVIDWIQSQQIYDASSSSDSPLLHSPSPPTAVEHSAEESEALPAPVASGQSPTLVSSLDLKMPPKTGQKTLKKNADIPPTKDEEHGPQLKEGGNP